jgi:hypothetical protein
LFATEAFLLDVLSPRCHAAASALPLRTTFAQMALSYRPSLDLHKVHSLFAPPFNAFGQQDATEFTRYLLDVELGDGAAAPAAASSPVQVTCRCVASACHCST